MDLSDLHPQDDYSHRFFIWHEWIQVSSVFIAVFELTMLRNSGKWPIDPGECLRLLRELYVLR
jgi:hypothetical protein